LARIHFYEAEYEDSEGAKEVENDKANVEKVDVHV
jgi:hypothetical protein